jgi:hypothetical protein
MDAVDFSWGATETAEKGRQCPDEEVLGGAEEGGEVDEDDSNRRVCSQSAAVVYDRRVHRPAWHAARGSADESLLDPESTIELFIYG